MDVSVTRIPIFAHRSSERSCAAKCPSPIVSSSPLCLLLILLRPTGSLQIDPRLRHRSDDGRKIRGFRGRSRPARSGNYTAPGSRQLPVQAPLGPDARRRADRPGDRLQTVGAVDIRAVALGIGGAGQHVASASSESGEGNRSCTTSSVQPPEPRRRGLVDPRRLVAAGHPNAADCAAVQMPAGAASNVSTRWVKWATTASTPRRLGHFSARDREPVGKSLVLAHRRHGPKHQQRLRHRCRGATGTAGRPLRRSDRARARRPAGRPCGGRRASSPARPVQRRNCARSPLACRRS